MLPFVPFVIAELVENLDLEALGLKAGKEVLACVVACGECHAPRAVRRLDRVALGPGRRRPSRVGMGIEIGIAKIPGGTCSGLFVTALVLVRAVVPMGVATGRGTALLKVFVVLTGPGLAREHSVRVPHGARHRACNGKGAFDPLVDGSCLYPHPTPAPRVVNKLASAHTAVAGGHTCAKQRVRATPYETKQRSNMRMYCWMHQTT